MLNNHITRPVGNRIMPAGPKITPTVIEAIPRAPITNHPRFRGGVFQYMYAWRSMTPKGRKAHNIRIGDGG